jgi:23S rRNA pseudouridine1911/1915/1917 synthase
MGHRVTYEGEAPRLVDYLKARLVLVPTREIGDLITSGAVHVNDAPGRTYEPLSEGDGITVDAAALAALEASGRWIAPEARDLDVHHEDAHLLVVAKPAGTHVHPMGKLRCGTLQNALVHHAGARTDDPWAEWRPRPAQRLDRAASGLLVVAKSAEVCSALSGLLTSNRLTRRYVAMVRGALLEPSGTIDAPLGRDPSFDYRRAALPLSAGGQTAVTHWEVAKRFDDRTLLEVEIETGRTHQIRAHLALLGHAIVGDTLYSLPPPAAGADPGHTSASVIALHATRLAFRHPQSGETVACTAPAPRSFGEAPL